MHWLLVARMYSSLKLCKLFKNCALDLPYALIVGCTRQWHPEHLRSLGHCAVTPLSCYECHPLRGLQSCMQNMMSKVRQMLGRYLYTEHLLSIERMFPLNVFFCIKLALRLSSEILHGRKLPWRRNCPKGWDFHSHQGDIHHCNYAQVSGGGAGLDRILFHSLKQKLTNQASDEEDDKDDYDFKDRMVKSCGQLQAALKLMKMTTALTTIMTLMTIQ